MCKNEFSVFKIACDTKIFIRSLFISKLSRTRKIEVAAYGRWDCWTGAVRKYRESLEVILVRSQSEGVMEPESKGERRERREKKRGTQKLFYWVAWKRYAGN